MRKTNLSWQGTADTVEFLQKPAYILNITSTDTLCSTLGAIVATKLLGSSHINLDLTSRNNQN